MKTKSETGTNTLRSKKIDFLSTKKAALFIYSILFLLLSEIAFSQRVAPEMEVNNFNLSSEKASKLQGFDTKILHGEVYLQWFCSNDKEEGVFIISRSENMGTFKIIGIKECHGTAEGTKTAHTYTDKRPVHGETYYRIMKVYRDGTYYYSDLKKVDFPESAYERKNTAL